jgi:glycosyltransferase involved in cell wall biosynthesis
MILGFHYHIPFSEKNGDIYFPSHFGLFIEELSIHVKELRLFLFRRVLFDPIFFDYKLSNVNIKLFEIAEEKAAYIKFFLAPKYLRKVNIELKKCDFILLRGPSPMSYAFSKYFEKGNITNLMVGDYLEGNKFIIQPFYRLLPVKLLNMLMHYRYISSIKGTKICFNSELLFLNYNRLGKVSIVINTGNIKLSDINFKIQKSYKNKEIIKLLYVGRIDWAKGFKEMLESIQELNSSGLKTFKLDIVGWDETKGEKVKTEILKIINSKCLNELITFHDKKKPGDELYEFYKNSDAFILPSYQEGFPRTLWEAFANGLPVITTSVGAIKYKLIDRKHALFCLAKNTNSLTEKIIEMISNEELMNECRSNGYLLVKENTIDIQVKLLMNFIINE